MFLRTDSPRRTGALVFAISKTNFDDAVIASWFEDWLYKQIVAEEEEEALRIPEIKALEDVYGPLWD